MGSSKSLRSKRTRSCETFEMSGPGEVTVKDNRKRRCIMIALVLLLLAILATLIIVLSVVFTRSKPDSLGESNNTAFSATIITVTSTSSNSSWTNVAITKTTMTTQIVNSTYTTTAWTMTKTTDTTTTQTKPITTTATTIIGNTDTTITIAETTTSAPCPTGYIQHPSGSCVNLLIDFNNCGSINYVCASTYISCSNGVCSGAPAVQLTGAVPVPGWGGQYNIDDAVVLLPIPFAVSLYGYSTSTVNVQSNGIICLARCSDEYINTALPSRSFTGPTAFGYWDDLYIYAGTSQSVYYGTIGAFPNRSLVFEYYMAHFTSSTRYYRFQIVFFESNSNFVQYRYFQASDRGASATIGTQASGSGPSVAYAVDVPNSIPAGSTTTTTPTFVLTFNTNTNTFSSSG